MAPGPFRKHSFRVGSGLALVYMPRMASFFLYLALHLEQVRGLSTLESGLLFVAATAILAMRRITYLVWELRTVTPRKGA